MPFPAAAAGAAFFFGRAAVNYLRHRKPFQSFLFGAGYAGGTVVGFRSVDQLYRTFNLTGPRRLRRIGRFY